MALTDHSQPAVTALDLRRVAALVAGDALAFLVFAAIGRASHSEAAGLDAIAQIAETAAPFALGWFVVAPFAGAFRSEIVRNPRKLLARTALAWLIAWPIGLVLRSLIRHSEIQLSFAIITLITNMLFLLGWRAVFAWLVARRSAQ